MLVIPPYRAIKETSLSRLKLLAKEENDSGKGSDLSPPSSSSNSPRELKLPPSPLSVDTKSYQTSYSFKSNNNLPVGQTSLTATTTTSSSSAAKSPVSKVHSESWSLKPYRREGAIASLKRLSLNSYGNNNNTAAAAVSSVKSEEQFSDTEIVKPRYSPSAHQPPKGLSPTSLKEIQVELKAVLNSLESFTMQQTRLNNSFPTESCLDKKLSSKNNSNSVSTVTPPDLVQNLPSFNDAVGGPNVRSASLTSVPATTPLFDNHLTIPFADTSSLAEQFAENKENTLKKNSYFPTVVDEQELSLNRQKSKPPVPRKPSTSPQSSRRTPNSQIECPNSAKF